MLQIVFKRNITKDLFRLFNLNILFFSPHISSIRHDELPEEDPSSLHAVTDSQH